MLADKCVNDSDGPRLFKTRILGPLAFALLAANWCGHSALQGDELREAPWEAQICARAKSVLSYATIEQATKHCGANRIP